MSRTVVAVDASVGVSAELFTAAWAEEPDAVAAEPAKVEAVPEGTFQPGGE